MIFFSESLDALAEQKAINNLKIYKSSKDWVPVTREQADEFYRNDPPEGKTRKARALEWEDIPRPTSDQIAQTNSDIAKIARDNAIDDYVGSILFDGSTYQSSERSKKDITDTLEGAALQGLPDSSSIQWRLEDNTYRETTVEELREILILVKMDVLQNKADVWSAFNAWQATDKQESFSYE